MRFLITIVLLAFLLADCADHLPTAYTPESDPRCATFEEFERPANAAHCQAEGLHAYHARYPGWSLLGATP